MRIVHKYKLGLIGGAQSLGLPIGAEVVHFDMQEGKPMLWVLVETPARLEERVFHIVGTGHWLPEGQALTYIGTTMDPPFVWHLFAEGVA